MTRGNRNRPENGPDRPTHSQRESSAAGDELRSVRLIRKYVDMIDGIDLEDTAVGDRLELPAHDADVLIAEGWAVADSQRRAQPPTGRAIAADRFHSPRKKPGN